MVGETNVATDRQNVTSRDSVKTGEATVNGKKVFGSSGQLRKKFRLGFLIYLYNIPDNKQFDAALSWTALN